MEKKLRARPLIVLAILVLTVLMVAPSCSGYGGYGTTPAPSSTPTSTPQPGATPAPIPASATVDLSNFSFSPATLTVKVGDTVAWTNKDPVAHTVTSDSGLFNSGDLAPSATFSFTFSNAGTFTYHCAIHTYMKGTIVVQ